jgi:hypothetical protein
MVTDEIESKHGLLDLALRFASFLPEVLGLFGTPGRVARGVGHAIRLVPAVRNATANRAAEGAREAAQARALAMAEAYQQVDDRCALLEQENIKMKFELAGAASQLQSITAEVQALRTEVAAMRKRNLYLSLGVLAVFLLAISELALRLVK